MMSFMGHTIAIDRLVIISHFNHHHRHTTNLSYKESHEYHSNPALNLHDKFYRAYLHYQ